MYEWDPGKAKANLVKHGVMFETARAFDWRTALVRFDAVHSRDEHRYLAVGYIGERLYVMVFTPSRPSHHRPRKGERPREEAL